MMTAIEEFRQRGFKLIAKDNLIIFDDNNRGRFFFYLDEERIGTSICYSSESKSYNRIIKKFQKELGWKNIKEINFW